MIIRIVRNFDNPDSDDIDLEVCLEDYDFDPDDEGQLSEFERWILLFLEKIEE